MAERARTGRAGTRGRTRSRRAQGRGRPGGAPAAASRALHIPGAAAAAAKGPGATGGGAVRLAETEAGTILFNLDPIIIKDHYEIDYLHSYAQDSPFFAGLARGVLLGSRCARCRYTFATPRAHCMHCGRATTWVELPREGRIHTWTTCYFGSQAFLPETPFTLILVEFDGVDTLFLSRLAGLQPEQARIGMQVRAQFLRNSKFRVTDVYFVPAEG
ncbi:MAG: Zn-ribbon domain-containing OB-fold protein [Deltaproteobacteria bacterium]|nr:Zn-ribbon domain-containing OB-fold protein [Deltaproteobacteria bacterium]